MTMKKFLLLIAVAFALMFGIAGTLIIHPDPANACSTPNC